MSNIKERKQLGEVMRKIESDIGKLNTELKNLKDGLVGESGFVVQCKVDGFEDESSVIKLSISPENLVSENKGSQELKKEPVRFFVGTLEGDIKASLVSNNVDSELGEWKLNALPVQHEFSLTIEEGVQNVMQLKMSSIDLASLSNEIATKEGEVEELFKRRKQAKTEMASLQQQAAAQAASATPSDTPGPGAIVPKTSIWKRILNAPVAMFQIGKAVIESPVKEVFFFCGGVALLYFKGEDLAV